MTRPTGTLISATNQLQVIRVLGAGKLEAEERQLKAIRNRRNYLSRTRTAGGRWAK
jgi:hypothetical protein